MKPTLRSLGLGIAAAAAVALLAGPAAAVSAGPSVGKPAPVFTGVDSNGKTIRLSDFRGKLVVLEWTNYGCPYVVRHYRSGNMQKTQRAARDLGVVWISIVSSAPGRQGYVKGPEANQLTETRNAAPHHVVLDPKGVIGRAYEATNTPHMYIVGKDGTLLYMGAIDDKPWAFSSEDMKKAKNYVLKALGEIKAGNKVSEPVTRAYGCSVKYSS